MSWAEEYTKSVLSKQLQHKSNSSKMQALFKIKTMTSLGHGSWR